MACGCHKDFAKSYMLLKIEEVGLFDVIHVLFSPNLNKRKFVDCSEGSLRDCFSHRWLIFISILAQKFLPFVAKPLAYFGSCVELFLNLISANQSLRPSSQLPYRRKMVVPDKASEKFLSFIGNLDRRVELDATMRHEDSKYNAAISVMASKASYENVAYLQATVEEHWKMEFVGFYDYWNGKNQGFKLRLRLRLRLRVAAIAGVAGTTMRLRS